MPGMGSGLDLNNPVLTGAFRSALAAGPGGPPAAGRPPLAGPASAPSLTAGVWGRSGATLAGLLRVGFGVLWVVDGVLQAQPAMVRTAVPRDPAGAASRRAGCGR
jgi:hypothetical protein